MGLVWQLIARADELPLWQETVLWEAKAAFLKIEVRRIPESKVRAFLIWVLGAYIQIYVTPAEGYLLGHSKEKNKMKLEVDH